MKYIKLFEDFYMIENELSILPKVNEFTFDGKPQLFKLNVEVDDQHRKWVEGYINDGGWAYLKLAHIDIEKLVLQLLTTIVEGDFKVVE